MGSKLSIENDTDHTYYVKNQINNSVLKWTLIGIAVPAATVGAGVISLGIAAVSSAAVSSVAVSGVAALTKIISANVITAITDGVTAGAEVLNVIVNSKALMDKISDCEKNGYFKLRPGRSYSYSGTLSLTRWITLINKEDGEEITRTCWTGATAGSNNKYKVSEHFGF